MKRFHFAVAGLLALTLQAEAIGFKPKMSEVCMPGPSIGGFSSFVNRKAFLSRLLEKQLGLAAIDLDVTGNDVTYAMKVAAVLDPEKNCKAGKCAEASKAKLGTAQVLLIDFLQTNTVPIAIGQSGYQVLVSGGRSPTIEAFLQGPEGAVRIACVDLTPREPPGPSKPGEAEANRIPQFFAIRKNVEDLRFSQKDDQFKKVERASATWKSDLLTRANSFGVDGAAGYTFGRGEIGNAIGQITPFVTYKQDYIFDPSDPKKNSRVFNVGGGVIGDLLFPAFGMYHNLQFYPKYVQSLSTGEQILSGNVVYSPEPAWSPFGQIYYLVPEILSFQLTPQVKAVYGHVFNDGGDPTRLVKGNYFRLGPRLAAAFYGEGILSGFVFTTSYEFYKSFEGPVAFVDRFEAAVNYVIGEQELWALQLKFVSGRDLDTLNKQQQITLGVGLKY